MLRGIVWIVLTLVLGLGIGVGSGWYAINNFARSGAIQHGIWRTNLHYGNASADMYLRASVSQSGLFALNRSETFYMTAYTDNQGKRLDGRCTYRVTGPAPNARWWSFTLYAADHFLVPNEAGKYAVSIDRNAAPAGQVDFLISPDRQAGNWLPSPGTEIGNSVTMRLYHPAPSVAADPTSMPVPGIRKVRC